MHEKIRVWSKISQTWDVQKKDLASLKKPFSFLIHGFIASRLLRRLLHILLVHRRENGRSIGVKALCDLIVNSWLLRVARHLMLRLIRLLLSLNVRVDSFIQIAKTVWQGLWLDLWLLNRCLAHPLVLGRRKASKSSKTDLAFQLWGKVWHLWLFFNIW